MLTQRQATTDDVELLHQLGGIAFSHTYREILSPEQMAYMLDWMYSCENLRQQMADGHLYFIAFDGQTPCGYVSISPEEEGKSFHLQKIYVLPEYQGRHVGSFLFRTAIEQIRKIHPTPCRMLLNVNRNNTKALEFYRRMGMSKVDEGDFPIGQGYYMNDYIMGLDI